MSTQGNTAVEISESTAKRGAAHLKRWVRSTDDRRIDALYEEYAAPAGAKTGIQLVRPFSVLSKTTYSAAILPPLGLAYLAAVVREAGYPVSIVDAQGEDMFNIRRSENGLYNLQGSGTEQIVGMIDPDTKIIGVSLMFSQEWPPQRELIMAIREKCPDAVIVAGGEHPSAFQEFTLRDCPAIDYVVSGEGELSFLELVYRVYWDEDPRLTAGVSYLKENGEFWTNGFSQRITNIDELPWPAWDLCKVQNYFQPNWAMGVNMGKHLPLLATRGCPYQCTFCSNPTMWTTRYKMRAAKSVADEIESFVEEYGIDSFDFFDLTAIVKKDWTLEFCGELKKRNLDISWQLPSGTRSEALDLETLTALYDTGCRLITYAPESGSERTLVNIKKKLKLGNLTESIRLAKEVGHIVKINLVIGFPDEVHGDLLSTLRYAIKTAWIGADDCNLAIFSPYPGSELYERLRKEEKLPAPDDGYFASLLVQFDLTKSNSYCDKVSGRSLAAYRVLTYLSFYSVAYIAHPSRIVRLARALLKPKFQPANVIEQRLSDFWVRRKNSSKHKTAVEQKS